MFRNLWYPAIMCKACIFPFETHGYTFFHCDSITKAGGVGAYFKNTLDAKHIQELSRSFDGCESLWIEVGRTKKMSLLELSIDTPIRT